MSFYGLIGSLANNFTAIVSTKPAETEVSEATTSQSFILETTTKKAVSALAIPPPGGMFFIPEDLSPAESSDDMAETMRSMIGTEAVRAVSTLTSAKAGKIAVVDEVFDAGRLGAGGIRALEIGGSVDVTKEVGVTPLKAFKDSGAVEDLRIKLGLPETSEPIVGEFTFPDTPIAAPSGSSDVDIVPISGPGLGLHSASAAVLAGERRRFNTIQESWVGPKLSPEEKPRVLAIMGGDILDGASQKAVLFIKKFSSKRGVVESYTILRKSIFSSADFKEVAIFESDTTPIPKKYLEIANSFPYDNKKLLVFEDTDILKNYLYLYRVKVKWSRSTTIPLTPAQETAVGLVAGIRFGGL